jgi:hypothetical protein
MKFPGIPSDCDLLSRVIPVASLNVVGWTWGRSFWPCGLVLWCLYEEIAANRSRARTSASSNPAAELELCDRAIQSVPGLNPNTNPFERSEQFARMIISVPKEEADKKTTVSEEFAKGRAEQLLK